MSAPFGHKDLNAEGLLRTAPSVFAQVPATVRTGVTPRRRAGKAQATTASPRYASRSSGAGVYSHSEIRQDGAKTGRSTADPQSRNRLKV